MIFTIPIQPMSLNNFYINVPKKGRVKSKKAKKWSEDLFLLLPQIDVPTTPFGMVLVFGTPYMETADLDNMVKPVVDVMQKKWDFNDKLINNYILQKKKTIRGAGYIEFALMETMRP